MSRGRFLLGLLVPGGLLLAWLALFSIWHETSQPLDRGPWLDRGLALGIVLLGAWLAVFPAWRYLVRRRLAHRSLPEWWFDVPGASLLASILVLGALIAGRVHGVALGDQPKAIRWPVTGLCAGLAGIGLLATVALTIEALLPGGEDDPAEVFR